MESFKEYKDMPMREILKHVGYEVFDMNIFGVAPSEDATVMYYPLKLKSNNKNPFFITFPLKEISHGG
jgi:hypothetical protein